MKGRIVTLRIIIMRVVWERVLVSLVIGVIM